MISLAQSDDLGGLSRRLFLLSEQRLEQRIRQDAALALKAAVGAAREQLRADLADPSGPIEGGATRWTIGGTYASRYVRPQELTAAVGFASDQPRAAGRYLRPLMRSTAPVIKGIDLRLAQGRRGLSFHPSPALPRTPQGNVSRATLGRVLAANGSSSTTFTRPLRGGSAVGVFQRSERRLRGTSTWDSEVRFLGVLKPGRTRRRTLDLEALLLPTIAESFSENLRAEVQRSLAKLGFS